jgi:hypothetical protein
MSAVEADNRIEKVITMIRCSFFLVAGVLVTVASCGGGDSGGESTTAVGPTTTVAVTTQADLVYATRIDDGRELKLDILLPPDPGEAPIVIGPYPKLADHGMIVITKVPDAESWGGPEEIAADRDLIRRVDEHLGCAVRFARARASEWGNDDPTIVLSGFSYSSGAAAQVALFGDTLDERWEEFAATGGPPRQLDCAVTEGSTDVDALLGVSGPNELSVPIFDGEYGLAYQQEHDPEMQQFLASSIGANPDLRIHLIHGTWDFIPVRHAETLAALLRDAGYDAEITTWDGGHDGPPHELLLSAVTDLLDR